MMRAARSGPRLQLDVRGNAAYLRSSEPLRAYPRRLTDRLAFWARVAPDRCFVTQRLPLPQGGTGWQALSYRQVMQQARSVGQALLARGLGPQSPLLLLSGRGLNQVSLVMGAWWAGVPVLSLTLLDEHGPARPERLQQALALIEPRLAYVSDSHAAMASPWLDDRVALLAAGDTVAGRAATPMQALLDTVPMAQLDAAHAAVGPDTAASIQLGPGVDGPARVVFNTHRMICSNQQMLRQSVDPLAGGTAVLFDGLPGSQACAGPFGLGLALYNGGTLCLDAEQAPGADGVSTLAAMAEAAPTIVCGRPGQLRAWADAAGADAALRRAVLRRLRLLLVVHDRTQDGLRDDAWSQAGLPALNGLTGLRAGAAVSVVAAHGLTETEPVSLVRRVHAGAAAAGAAAKSVGAAGARQARRGPRIEAPAASVGDPCPGVEIKVALSGPRQDLAGSAGLGLGPHPPEAKPDGNGDAGASECVFGAGEMCIRGPHLAPTHWPAAVVSDPLYDDEGYYRSGDLVRVQVGAAGPCLVFVGKARERALESYFEVMI